MAHKDYYKILDLGKKAGPQDIKRAYRRLALLHHPDRNPGKKAEEERFKEISEAYGVLIDPKKRQEYDLLLKTGFDNQRAHKGFRYSQDEIFRDIFKNPHASDIFQELGKEFSRFGFRFDESFFKQHFFKGRGIFFGGIFFFGPLLNRSGFKIFGPDHAEKTGAQHRVIFPTHGQEIVGKIARTVGKLLLGTQPSGKDRVNEIPGASSKNREDITYSLSINRKEALSGADIKIAYPRNGRNEKVKVKIPPGTKDGTRLRLQGMGSTKEKGGSTPGDLYIHVNVQ